VASHILASRIKSGAPPIHMQESGPSKKGKLVGTFVPFTS